MPNINAPKKPTTLSVVSHSSHGNDWSGVFMTLIYRAGVVTPSHLIRL